MGYCPECRSEYQPQITRCDACGVDLVAQLPPEEELVPVYASTEVLEANLVRETLIAEGVDAALPSSEAPVFPTSGVPTAPRVLVARSAAKHAYEVLDAALEAKLFGAFGEIVKG